MGDAAGCVASRARGHGWGGRHGSGCPAALRLERPRAAPAWHLQRAAWAPWPEERGYCSGPPVRDP
eukprot:18503-Alexandrium_andersonii.AAC.1